MNPLCCIAPVSIENNPHPTTTARSVSSKNLVMEMVKEEEEAAVVAVAVAGVLYKWVNYGKGWRARWFVLRDGVLSYYKVHGPDKIWVGSVWEGGEGGGGGGGGVRVIGE